MSMNLFLEQLPSEIVLSSKLDWPKFGRMYSILCVINGLAFFLFAFISDYDMAQKLNLDTKTFLMKMFIGSINIGIQNKRSILIRLF